MRMRSSLARCSALAAGVLAGLFGVGGGILFVPTLTLVLGLTQLHAEATLAARDHADGRGGRRGASAIRQRPLACGARAGLGAIAGVEAGRADRGVAARTRAAAAVRAC